MLAEELGGTVVAGCDPSLARLDLETARPYMAGSGQLRGSCLYVLAADGLADAERRSPFTTFAVIGGGTDVPAAWDGRRDLLVLPDEDGIAPALDRILAVFERFSTVEREMARRAIAGRSATAILEPATDLLKNPIVLSDLAFGVLGRTGAYDPARTDLFWDEIEHEGYAKTLPMDTEQLRRLRASRGPILTELEGVPVVQLCVRSEGEPVAFMGSTELYGPITDGQAAISWWVGQEVGALWPLIERDGSNSIQSDFDLTEQTVLRVIEQMPVNREVIVRMLARRSWQIDDRYRMLCLYRTGEELDATAAGRIMQDLPRALPKAIVLPYGGCVLAILHGDDALAAPDEGSLAGPMAEHGLCCTVSTIHDDFQHLDRALAQCRIARGVAEGDGHPAGTVTEFHEALPAYLLGVAQEAQDADVLIDPQVAALAHRQHGDDFVHSLRTYLACGRNMSRAARELYVHRGTLVYRIEQIEGELGYSLDEADESRLFHLYLSCCLLEQNRAEV